MLVTMLVSYCRSKRREAGNIMVSFRLSKVMVTNAINKNRQDRPGYKENNYRLERVDHYTDFKPGRSGRKPVDR